MNLSGGLSFKAENPLGKLCKWLRILGFDTIYEQEIGPARFTAADHQGRILLTRRRSMADGCEPEKCIFIRSDHVFEQVKEIIALLGLSVEDIAPFSRCARCNGALEGVDKRQAIDSVPDYVWETQSSFRACTGCRRIYWAGSHTRRAAGIIETLFEK